MLKSWLGEVFRIMRKIEKKILYSKEYEKWLKDLEDNDKPHPNYDKGTRKYYNDVKLELLRCQGGLCAYTEMKLCGTEVFSVNKWENGRYKAKEKIKSLGQLDHFNPKLKKEKGWLWANFFVVHSDVNISEKRDKSVDYILKPDVDDYVFSDKMLFKADTNMFTPNPEKTFEEQKRIQEMIDTLGINYEPVRSIRSDFIKRLRKAIEYQAYDSNDYQNSEFPTTLAFIIEEKGTQN